MAVVFNVLWTYARWNRRLIREDFPESQRFARSRRHAPSACRSPVVILLLATWTPVGGVIFAFALSAFYLPGVTLRFDRS